MSYFICIYGSETIINKCSVLFCSFIDSLPIGTFFRPVDLSNRFKNLGETNARIYVAVISFDKLGGAIRSLA